MNGQGMTLFCSHCAKDRLSIVKERENSDGVREYFARCSSCGEEISSPVLLQNNEWFRKEQEILKKYNGMFLVAEGDPVPQGRPRFSSYGGRFIHAYDPKESVAYKIKLQWYIRMFFQRHPGFKPLEKNIFMDLRIYRKIPNSFTKKKREEISKGLLYPNTKPDTDNYVKAVLDASNGLVFHDDSAVIGFTAFKYYSDLPRIEASFVEINSSQDIVFGIK